MEIDQTSYNDLSVFQHEEEYSIFHKLNLTSTAEGKEWLYKFFKHPLNNIDVIKETQAVIQLIFNHLNKWPTIISNGTVMVMVKFYDANINTPPSSPGIINTFSYKLINGPDYSLLKYSVTHFADFLRGIKTLVELLDQEETPLLLKRYLLRINDLTDKPLIRSLMQHDKGKELSIKEIITYGRFLRYQYKTQVFELIDIFGRLDAWCAMAKAHKKFNLSFPEFKEETQPLINAKGLFHILIPNAVPYNVDMNVDSNFIFLTGANMAGKSTFIKAIGSAVFLAHLGMGVPAQKFTLTVFDGLLSNINVVDNVIKGESYFFNEVQRIKNTIVKINDNRKWLVLIDELFKGTNVQDAMKCSTTVIKGLIKISNSLFILSTHLYEIGDELKDYQNISFKYFETNVQDEQLSFNYQLKNGISNDRIGYVILKREKVVEMLEKL